MFFTSEFCLQDFKDKGFNFKLRLKEQGKFPAIAIGLNDFAGTGIYSSEYIVGSYGINRTDFHFGLGWGSIEMASDLNFKNPLIIFLTNLMIDQPIQKVKARKFSTFKVFFWRDSFTFFWSISCFKQKVDKRAEYDSSVRPGFSSF